VDLESGGCVPEAGDGSLVTGREPFAGNRRERAGGSVEQRKRRISAQVSKGLRIDGARCVQGSTQRLQMSDERLRDSARSSAGNRPSDSMCGDAKHKARSGTQRLIEGQKGMRGEAGKQRAGADAFELVIGE